MNFHNLLREIGGNAALPLTAGLVAALLAYLGWQKLSAESISIQLQNTWNYARFIQTLNALLIFLATFLLVFLITTSREIAISIGLLLTSIPFLLARRKVESAKRLRERSWPEAIDGIVSSLQSGQSVIEAINELSEHGPEPLRTYFVDMALGLREAKSLAEVASSAMDQLQCAIADQVLTVILFAKEYGGQDVTTTLRLLASFLRDNDQARAEVETRFGWVRNSALLGAVSPWLLLALLSLQPKTVAAYASPAGRIVLSVGIISTALAFLWMGKVSRLPEIPRAYAEPDLRNLI